MCSYWSSTLFFITACSPIREPGDAKLHLFLCLFEWDAGLSLDWYSHVPPPLIQTVSKWINGLRTCSRALLHPPAMTAVYHSSLVTIFYQKRLVTITGPYDLFSNKQELFHMLLPRLDFSGGLYCIPDILPASIWAVSQNSTPRGQHWPAAARVSFTQLTTH